MEKVKKHNYGKLAFIFLVFGYLGSIAEKPHGMSAAEALGVAVAQAAFPLAGLTFLVFWIMDKVRKGKNGSKKYSVESVSAKEISKQHVVDIEPEKSEMIKPGKYAHDKKRFSLNSILKVSLIVLVFVLVIVTLGFFFRVDTRYFTYSEQQCRDAALRDKIDWKAKYSGVNNDSALLLYTANHSTYLAKDCSTYSSDQNIEFARWNAKLKGGEFGSSDWDIIKAKYVSVFDKNPITILSERDLCEATHKLSDVADATFKKICRRPTFFKQ